jgi:diaminohydroxyphosphoribosylaminopyrimidine deaminase / 5-amino-6-(5-phosphoribosylamino)uracil reductase
MTRRQEEDRAAMRECIRLARNGEGYVSPNPMVGAVLVKNGRIVAKGFHRAFGGPHAEVECLAQHRGSFEGATLYVNLEPCAHFGKTPPCADLLAATPIPRIVLAMTDPNPVVSGQGIARLRAAGKKVEVGVLEQEARALNRHFVTAITQQRPYVHVKIAQSLDGMIASSRGRPRWISGQPARQLVHQWRSVYDAVIVGAGTIRADDPRLTARREGGRNPAAVVVDGNLTVSPDARLFRNFRGRQVFVCTTRRALDRKTRVASRLEKSGVVLVPFRSSERIPLPNLLRQLYALNLGSLLVEGGSDLFGQFLRSRLVDELTVFIAPIVIGEGVPAYAPDKIPARRAGFDNLTTGMIGTDIMLKWLRSQDPSCLPES